MSPLMSDVPGAAIFSRPPSNDRRTGPAMTAREVLATLGATLVALGPVMAVHWIATVLQ